MIVSISAEWAIDNMGYRRQVSGSNHILWRRVLPDSPNQSNWKDVANDRNTIKSEDRDVFKYCRNLWVACIADVNKKTKKQKKTGIR